MAVRLRVQAGTVELTTTHRTKEAALEHAGVEAQLAARAGLSPFLVDIQPELPEPGGSTDDDG